MKYYRVSEEALRNYLAMAHRYRALECGGVDSWAWHDESIANYIQDCSVIDETNYEDINEIVETDMASMEKCKCEPKESVLDTFLECLGQIPLQ